MADTDTDSLLALLVPIAVECETVQRDADLDAQSIRDERKARAARFAVVRGIE
jgi:hypothetical protein